MTINVLGSPENTEEMKRRLDREKSKRKIVKYFLSGEERKHLGVPDADVDTAQEQQVGEKLLSGEISIESRKKLMAHIQGPIELLGEKTVFNGNPDRGCEGIAGQDKERKILAKTMKVKASELTPLDLAEFEEQYPTPIDFERKAADYLRSVARTATPEQYAEHVQALESFQRKVYGEKFEYYIAMQALMREAEERASMPPFAGDVVRTRTSAEGVEGATRPGPRVRPGGGSAEGSSSPDTERGPRVRPGGEGGEPMPSVRPEDYGPSTEPAPRTMPDGSGERPETGLARRTRPVGDDGGVEPLGSQTRVSVSDLERMPAPWRRRGGPAARESEEVPVGMDTGERTETGPASGARPVGEDGGDITGWSGWSRYSSAFPSYVPLGSRRRPGFATESRPTASPGTAVDVEEHAAPIMDFPFEETAPGEEEHAAPTMNFPHEGPTVRKRRITDESIASKLIMPYEYVGPKASEVDVTGETHEEETNTGGTGRRHRRAERFRVELRDGKPLSPEVGRQVVEKAKLEGDELLVENDGTIEPYTVKNEDMLLAELDPSCETEVDGVWIGLSDVFLVDGAREAAVAYVQGPDGEIHARSYYRSGRDAVWRYLPDRMQDDGTSQVVWYGKGCGEESLTLPAELQAVLNRRAQAADLKPESEMTDDERRVSERRRRVFYGVAKSVRDPKLRAAGAVDDALSKEVDNGPTFAFLDGVPPEALMPVRDPSWPDFAKEVATSESESEIYGHITFHTYESENGELRWTIIEDDRGQAWVGHVETRAPITSTGLRSRWIKAGGFERSLYEFPTRAKGYGDITDAVYGTDGSGGKYVRYVSMWKEYLSKLALIRDYKAKDTK